MNAAAAGTDVAAWPRRRALPWLRPDAAFGSIEREHCKSWLQRVRDTPHTILSAPAGFGKTALMRAWFERLHAAGEHTWWVELDASDRHSSRLLQTLAEAVGIAFPPPAGFGELRPSAIEQIAERLYSLQTPLFLFVDEVNRLAGEVAHRALHSLMNHPPHNLHLILAGRGKANLPIARCKANGTLWELLSRDLSFNDAEIAELLAGAGVADITRDLLRRVMEVTDGWPVAVRVVCGKIAEAGNRAPLEAVNAVARNCTSIAEFFRDEVLVAQAPDILEFMRLTSIADWLHPSLCEALTGRKDSAEILRRMDASGMFLTSAETGSEDAAAYKYHPLLAQFLRRQLVEADPASVRALNLRASEWLDRAGHYWEAFNHAVDAGDPQRAAAIMNPHCDDLYASGRERLIVPSMSRLPAAVKARHPKILLAMSWRYVSEWRLEQSRLLMDHANRRVAELADDPQTSAEELASLRRLIDHRRIMHAIVDEDYAYIDAHAEPLLRRYCEASPYVIASLYAATMFSQREQLKLARHDSLVVSAREQLRSTRSKLVLIFFEAFASPGHLLRGQLKSAIRVLESALTLSEETPDFDRAVGAGVALALAEALYEQDHASRAAALLNAYMPFATTAGFTDQLISGWITQSRLRAMQGDTDGALQSVDSATAFATERGLTRLAVFAGEQRIKLHIDAGDSAAALEAAAALGLKRHADSVMPLPSATMRSAIVAMAWVRIAKLSGHLQDALSVAKRWRQLFSSCGAIRSAVQWDILIAQILLALGDQRAARRTFLRALAAAAPGELVRSFLDEARGLAPLAVASSDETRSRADQFAARVCAAILRGDEGTAQARASDAEATAEALTLRETEILRMVGTGLLNAEIGRTLGMSEGSVKWYLQCIYDKFGVRRRVLAVQYARRIGLIN